VGVRCRSYPGLCSVSPRSTAGGSCSAGKSNIRWPGKCAARWRLWREVYLQCPACAVHSPGACGRCLRDPLPLGAFLPLGGLGGPDRVRASSRRRAHSQCDRGQLETTSGEGEFANQIWGTESLKWKAPNSPSHCTAAALASLRTVAEARQRVVGTARRPQGKRGRDQEKEQSKRKLNHPNL
jgi:hypothetical protein